jgi:hypothetical protein
MVARSARRVREQLVGDGRDGVGDRERLLRAGFSHWAMRRRGYLVILVRNSQALATPPVSATGTGTIST